MELPTPSFTIPDLVAIFLLWNKKGRSRVKSKVLWNGSLEEDPPSPRTLFWRHWDRGRRRGRPAPAPHCSSSRWPPRPARPRSGGTGGGAGAQPTAPSCSAACAACPRTGSSPSRTGSCCCSTWSREWIQYLVFRNCSKGKNLVVIHLFSFPEEISNGDPWLFGADPDPNLGIRTSD